MTRVLLIGFTAEAVDLTGKPYDVEALRTAIEDGDAAVVSAGYEVRRGWIGADHGSGVAEVRRLLDQDRFDVVLIGDGIRGNPRHTELFEDLVNLVHELAPRARFAFNAQPADTVAALRRQT